MAAIHAAGHERSLPVRGAEGASIFESAFCMDEFYA